MVSKKEQAKNQELFANLQLLKEACLEMAEETRKAKVEKVTFDFKKIKQEVAVELAEQERKKQEAIRHKKELEVKKIQAYRDEILKTVEKIYPQVAKGVENSIHSAMLRKEKSTPLWILTSYSYYIESGIEGKKKSYTNWFSILDEPDVFAYPYKDATLVGIIRTGELIQSGIPESYLKVIKSETENLSKEISGHNYNSLYEVWKRVFDRLEKDLEEADFKIKIVENKEKRQFAYIISWK